MSCAVFCVMKASLWQCLLWMRKSRSWGDLPFSIWSWSTGSGEYTSISSLVPSVQLYKGRCWSREGFPQLQIWVPSGGASTNFLCEMAPWYALCCFWEFGYDIPPMVWGFPFNELLEHARHFPRLILDVVLHCTSFRLLLCSGVFSAKTTLYLPRVLWLTSLVNHLSCCSHWLFY